MKYGNGIKVSRSAQDRAARKADIEAAFRERDERLARVNKMIENIVGPDEEDYLNSISYADEERYYSRPYRPTELDRLMNEREVLQKNITRTGLPFGESYYRVMKVARDRNRLRTAAMGNNRTIRTLRRANLNRR